MTSTNRRALYLAFAGMGATASLVPAVLPVLASSFGSQGERILVAAPILFAGLLVGVLLSPLVSRSRGVATTVRAGAVVQAVALALLAGAATSWMVFAAAAVAGIGFGLVEASGTALARQVAPDRTARMLTTLTATVAVVAAVGPLLVVATGAHGFRLVLVAAAIAQLLAAALVRSGEKPVVVATVSARRVSVPLVLVAVALFCYVGVESSLSGLSAVTVQTSLDTSAAVAAAGTSAFWLLMTAGRLAGAAILGRGARPWALATVSLALVAGFFLAAAGTTSGSPVAGIVLLALAVLACGPCYALLLGAASEWMNAATSAGAIAALIAVGAVGGTVVPSIVIAVGGLRDAAWIPAVVGLVAALAIVAGRLTARKATA